MRLVLQRVLESKPFPWIRGSPAEASAWAHKDQVMGGVAYTFIPWAVATFPWVCQLLPKGHPRLQLSHNHFLSTREGEVTVPSIQAHVTRWKGIWVFSWGPYLFHQAEWALCGLSSPSSPPYQQGQRLWLSFPIWKWNCKFVCMCCSAFLSGC